MPIHSELPQSSVFDSKMDDKTRRHNTSGLATEVNPTHFRESLQDDDREDRFKITPEMRELLYIPVSALDGERERKKTAIKDRALRRLFNDVILPTSPTEISYKEIEKSCINSVITYIYDNPDGELCSVGFKITFTFDRSLPVKQQKIREYSELASKHNLQVSELEKKVESLKKTLDTKGLSDKEALELTSLKKELALFKYQRNSLEGSYQVPTQRSRILWVKLYSLFDSVLNWDTGEERTTKPIIAASTPDQVKTPSSSDGVKKDPEIPQSRTRKQVPPTLNLVTGEGNPENLPLSEGSATKIKNSVVPEDAAQAIKKVQDSQPNVRIENGYLFVPKGTYGNGFSNNGRSSSENQTGQTPKTKNIARRLVEWFISPV